MRGVNYIIGDIAYRAQLLCFLEYRVLYRAAGLCRQRVRTARFLIALYDDRGLCLHEQDLIAEVHLAKGLEGAENILYSVFFADIGHERDLLIAPLCRRAQLGKLRDERNGHVIHAVVVKILYDVRGLALSAAGQSGYDKKLHTLSPSARIDRGLLCRGLRRLLLCLLEHLVDYRLLFLAPVVYKQHALGVDAYLRFKGYLRLVVDLSADVV